MAWIPATASSRNGRCSRSNKLGVIIGLIFALVLGVMFFFFFGMGGFTIMSSIPWIFISSIGIFLVLIVVMAVAASNMSSPKNPYNKEQSISIQKENQQFLQSQQVNPYKIQRSFQNQTSITITDRVKDDPFSQKVETNFCGFCGAKIEREAAFCHLCGSKL